MSAISASEVIDLARYAHDELKPIYDEARAIEPTITFYTECTFSGTGGWAADENSISISAHWDRDGMLTQEGYITTREEIHRIARDLRLMVAGLRVKGLGA